MGFWKKAWDFIWNDDSLLSWIVNLVLAFIIVKFIIYPGIGLMLGTSYPLVAVVSSSMEHKENFDEWWFDNSFFYAKYNITKEDFADFRFRNGFNKGDIMVLKGKEAKDIKTGDVVVYENTFNRNPIIHRVIRIEKKEGFYFITKGDNNPVEDQLKVSEDQIERTGTAVFRIPILGYIKIMFTSLMGVFF
ncbi:MAG: signal peptidase I [Nanoarchaeota archaeon]